MDPRDPAWIAAEGAKKHRKLSENVARRRPLVGRFGQESVTPVFLRLGRQWFDCQRTYRCLSAVFTGVLSVLGREAGRSRDEPPGGETCTLNGQGAEWETLRYYYRKPVGSTAPFGTCGVRPVFCSSAPPVCRRLPGGGKACQQNGRRETLTIIRPRHILVLAGWIRPPASAQEGRETSQISQVLLSSSPWSIQARYAADRHLTVFAVCSQPIPVAVVDVEDLRPTTSSRSSGGARFGSPGVRESRNPRIQKSKNLRLGHTPTYRRRPATARSGEDH